MFYCKSDTVSSVGGPSKIQKCSIGRYGSEIKALLNITFFHIHCWLTFFTIKTFTELTLTFFVSNNFYRCFSLLSSIYHFLYFFYIRPRKEVKENKKALVLVLSLAPGSPLVLVLGLENYIAYGRVFFITLLLLKKVYVYSLFLKKEQFYFTCFVKTLHQDSYPFSSDILSRKRFLYNSTE